MKIQPQARKLSAAQELQRFSIRLYKEGVAVRELSDVYISSEIREGRRIWTAYRNPELPEDLCTLEAVEIDVDSSVGIQASAYWLRRGRAVRVAVHIELAPRAQVAPRTRSRRTA